MQKKRTRLYPHEAEYLGFKVKPNENGRNQSRYLLTEHQIEKLKEFRQDYIESTPLSIKATSTLKDKDGNVLLEWIKKDKTEEDRLRALRIAVEELKKDLSHAKPVKVKKRDFNSSLINQYTITDHHFGMMAWDEESGDNWDIKIAEKVLVNFFHSAIEQSPNAETAILANIGDFLHWDGLDPVTPTNRHVLDADTRFTKLVRVVIRVIRKVINMLLGKYKKVILIMCEGNHDLASSVWLREMFYSFYDKEIRLSIDNTPDAYYSYSFGETLLFYHHGHKRNVENIDSVFVSKFKEDFGKSKHVYAHMGHKHSQKIKETSLMTIEQHRTLASKDSYASKGGYESGRDAKVITYHKKYGEVKRSTFNIDMLN